MVDQITIFVKFSSQWRALVLSVIIVGLLCFNKGSTNMPVSQKQLLIKICHVELVSPVVV